MRIEFLITPSTVFRKIACKLILVYFWSLWANWNTTCLIRHNKSILFCCLLPPKNKRKNERERERERGRENEKERERESEGHKIITKNTFIEIPKQDETPRLRRSSSIPADMWLAQEETEEEMGSYRAKRGSYRAKKIV